ncbi:hypothetical protein C0995_009571 [Termitomyces sp. Mi166|nr:hypothetical protein C0995_009571 [Termitomyces sp. Mi166\
MQLQSLSLALALLFPQIVVGNPTNASSKQYLIDASSNPAITLNATYIWDLKFHYNNTNNAGEIQCSIILLDSIVERYDLNESGSYTSQTFNEAVSSEAKKLSETSSIQLESGTSYSPVSASLTASGFETSKEVSNILEQTTRDQKEETDTDSYTRGVSRNYTVGPKSMLVLYQRVFKGPGITVQEEIFRTEPEPLSQEELEEEVPINLVLAQKKFIKGFKIVYSDEPNDAPADRVREWFKSSDDINDTFGGK